MAILILFKKLHLIWIFILNFYKVKVYFNNLHYSTEMLQFYIKTKIENIKYNESYSICYISVECPKFYFVKSSAEYHYGYIFQNLVYRKNNRLLTIIPFFSPYNPWIGLLFQKINGMWVIFYKKNRFRTYALEKISIILMWSSFTWLIHILLEV